MALVAVLIVGRHSGRRRRALEYFTRIEPQMFRFPAIDAPTFRRAVEEAFGP